MNPLTVPGGPDRSPHPPRRVRERQWLRGPAPLRGGRRRGQQRRPEPRGPELADLRLHPQPRRLQLGLHLPQREPQSGAHPDARLVRRCYLDPDSIRQGRAREVVNQLAT